MHFNLFKTYLPYNFGMTNLLKIQRIRFISNVIWLLEYILFYPKLRRVLLKLPKRNPKTIIFDVGANRGQSVKFYSKIFSGATILSFEPSPRIFATLKKLEIENFQPFNLGLSAVKGTSTFYVSMLDEASTFDLPDLNSEWHKTKSKILGVSRESMYTPITVEINTIDNLVVDRNIQNIFLLKIDVEGHEIKVLEGARLSLKKRIIQNIQIERHADDLRDSHEEEISSLLTQNGFRCLVSIRHSIGNFYEDIFALEDS